MRANFTLVIAVTVLAASAPATLTAQDPAPASAEQAAPLLGAAQILSASQLAALADSLPAGPLATRQIARFDGLSNMLGRRDTSGVNERHEDATDIFVVQRGRARLLYGGTADGERVTAPGEWRGGTIRNGTERELAQGDIVVIPAGVPHQLLLAPGESFYYFVFKVAKQTPR
jgi:mannose-6-phosphate isomerase-like protein (cupin superfamily)